MLKKQENIIKHNLKDSVFTNLFSRSEYLLQLYQTLHPEDLEITENDLSTVTINNLITNGIHNDLGFTVRDASIHLIEAQSTWSSNIVFRELEYIIKSYRKYLEDTDQNKYSTKKLHLPRPELYVIYTGDKAGKPEYLHLKDLFVSKGFTSIDLSVKILYYEGGKDIISQYAAFAMIYDRQRKSTDDLRLAVKETIRVCKNGDILKAYLEEHESEVEDIMLGFYDPEEEMREYVRCEVAHAKKEAFTQSKADSVCALMETMNISQEAAIKALGISGDEKNAVCELLSQKQACAD